MIIAYVLDRSGSMYANSEATINSFNEHFDQLIKECKNNYALPKVYMTLFSGKVDFLLDGVPLDSVEKLNKYNYKPSGWTAYYDAVGMTLDKIQSKIACDKCGGSNQKVMFVIVSDGLENDSKEYTQKQVDSKISKLQASGNWEFIYIGKREFYNSLVGNWNLPSQNSYAWDGTGGNYRTYMTNTVSNFVSTNSTEPIKETKDV